MSVMSSMFGHLPGIGTLIETFEQAYTWGPYPRYWTSGYIDATASDPTNNPTWELRPGLVMGKITATGTWTNYNPLATNGTQVAQGVLPLALRMQDIITGVNTARFYAIMASGGVQASKLIGLDNMARAQMSSLFYFDDNLPGNHVFPYQQFQLKTSNYQILASDNLTEFLNTGATGEVDLTLPPIANGYYFALKCMAAQVFKFISNEGGNMVTTTLTGSNVSVTAIGGGVAVYTQEDGTKWQVENLSSYNQVVSFG